MKRILFISGSLGLGHVTRDLAIAQALRRMNPGLRISWLASSPARETLQEAGEELLPEADSWSNESASAENASRPGGFELNVLSYLLKSRKEWANNVALFHAIMARERFDVVVGDETYEISLSLKENPALKKAPFVMMFDFVGLDSMTRNPLEKLGVYVWNMKWAKGYKVPATFVDISLFLGEPEDIPDESFGFFLPDRREWARCRNLKYTGYVLTFDPGGYSDKTKVRRSLGYGDEPVVLCSAGGTSVGREFLNLCGSSGQILSGKIPNLHMVLNCGPRIPAATLEVPREIDVKGYMPRLYEHFAACDLAVVQAGGTTTLELTALRIPFLYFPLEAHCEQQVQVSGRLKRLKAGVRMDFTRTTPAILADTILSHIGETPSWPPIRTDGAEVAAKLITGLLIREGQATP
jgi:predicted glycosyltransferase